MPTATWICELGRLVGNQAETQKLLMVALNLSVAERYRLAFLIAESLGYALIRKPA